MKCLTRANQNKIYSANTAAKNLMIIILLLTVVLSVSGCSSADKPEEVNIAEQFGIAYAPLQIMKEQHLLEKALPGVKINWKQYGGPIPMREAMLAGEVDFGLMGSAPVLIGIDNGMKWKYATGISSNLVALVTDNPNIKTLKDFSGIDRIAIISPGSTQHALLCIASNQVFGDPNMFDNQIVSLSHPDAMDALIADTEIVAHFATPPYIDKELAQGMHIITTGEEIMGQPFTFITGVALEDFYESQPNEYDAVIEAINTSIDFINNNMDEAVSILAPVYGIDQATLKAQMTYNGTIYSSKLMGVEKLADEMYKIKMLKNPIDFNDAIFPKSRV
jgi:NitT/TauT family transport system substrate-binding protein